MKGSADMTNKTEASKEVRLWIRQIIVPAIFIGTILWSNDKVKAKIIAGKDKIVSKFHKEK